MYVQHVIYIHRKHMLSKKHQHWCKNATEAGTCGMHQLQMGWPPKSHTCIVKICCQKWSKCDAQSASLATFSSDLLLSQIHRNPFLCLWKSSSKDTAKNHSKNAMGFKSPQHAPRARQPHPGTSVAMVADSSNPKFVRRLPSLMFSAFQ